MAVGTLWGKSIKTAGGQTGGRPAAATLSLEEPPELSPGLLQASHLWLRAGGLRSGAAFPLANLPSRSRGICAQSQGHHRLPSAQVAASSLRPEIPARGWVWPSKEHPENVYTTVWL